MLPMTFPSLRRLEQAFVEERGLADVLQPFLEDVWAGNGFSCMVIYVR
jgi:hypothetical protein